MSPQDQCAATDLTPLSPAVFHILLSLGEGERHGYAIKREIAARTQGKLKLGPGVLYGSINKMLELGLIEESADRPDPHLDDERRRYYPDHPLWPQGSAGGSGSHARVGAVGRGKVWSAPACVTSLSP